MIWERAWMIAAAVLVITAAIFLWRNNLSAAFVTGVLGACAWFLSYRAQLRARMIDRDEAEVSTESDSDRASAADDSDPIKDQDDN
jgi:hypothetical protein